MKSSRHSDAAFLSLISDSFSPSATKSISNRKGKRRKGAEKRTEWKREKNGYYTGRLKQTFSDNPSDAS